MSNINPKPRGFKIKPKKVLVRNRRSSFDGIRMPQTRMLSAQGGSGNFVLVGSSYQKISEIVFSNKFVNDLEDISDLIFSDVNTYISYVLSRSSVFFVCIHSVTVSVTNSILLKSISNVFGIAEELKKYPDFAVGDLYNKLIRSLSSFIGNIYERYEIINDYILADLINELLSLLKIARKSLKFLMKLAVTPVLTVLALSITTVGVSASTIDNSAIDQGSDLTPILQQQEVTVEETNFDIQPLQISESDYTINFTALKQDLQKAAQKDLAQNNENDLNNQYTIKIGDNLDNLSKRWGVSKEYIILSNLGINFFDNEIDINNQSIFIPSEKSIWLNVKKDTNIIDIAKTLELPTSTVLTWQPQTDKTDFEKGDQIVLVNPELDSILRQVDALINDGIVVSDKEIFNQVVEDNETKKELARKKAEEEKKKKEEEELKKKREQEAAEAKKKAEEAEAKLAEIEKAQAAEKQKLIEEQAAIKQADIQANQNVSVWPTTGSMSRCDLYYHPACDIANRVGTAIVSFRSGTVIESGWKSGGFGNMVRIDHGGGLESIYMHMSSVSVYTGQYVTAGQYLGGMGSTGNSTGSHLHFSLFVNGVETSPLRYLVWR